MPNEVDEVIKSASPEKQAEYKQAFQQFNQASGTPTTLGQGEAIIPPPKHGQSGADTTTPKAEIPTTPQGNSTTASSLIADAQSAAKAEAAKLGEHGVKPAAQEVDPPQHKR
jgi:hypothetical protein